MNLNSLVIGGLPFGSKLNRIETYDFLNFAFNLGIRNLDTGSLYGNYNSEKFISDYQTKYNNFFNIHTKVGLKKVERTGGSFGVEIDDLSPEKILSAGYKVSNIFKNKKIHRLSLHSFCKSTPVHKQVNALEVLIKENVIESYGICNFEPDELKYWLDICQMKKLTFPSSLDVHFNIFEQRALKSIFPLLEKYSISAIPYRVLSRGLLANRYKDVINIPKNSRGFSSWRVKRYVTEEYINAVKYLDQYALKNNLDLLTLNFMWLFNFDCVKKICIGTASEKQLEEITSRIKSLNKINSDIINNIDYNFLPQSIFKDPDTFFEK
ncbi:aldo/keto reductase [Prochlorococcus sp. AH-716-K03]|nr:aldo/keto reductase [Prochlorococcus sp. AH-716-K03]